jgi:hypothetical protein
MPWSMYIFAAGGFILALLFWSIDKFDKFRFKLSIYKFFLMNG